MANQAREGPQANAAPHRDGVVPVIRPLALPGRDSRAPAPNSFVMAGVLSLVIHAALLSLFLLVTVRASGAGAAAETETVTAEVDDDKPSQKNLTNEDEGGLDPNELLSYPVNRIEKESVPGPEDPTENVGIKDAPESLPKTDVPPPPGLFNDQGQSGGPDGAPGLANPYGLPGGLQGSLVPGGFGGRSGSTKEKLLREGGGNTATEAAVARGLAWLVNHQAPDGHWSLDGFHQHGHCNCTGAGQNDNIAATAFGLLPLLGAGETHKNKQGKYSKQVERALRYLMLKQTRDGNFGGTMYSHGLATIAVCEAYGMTSDPLLKGPAQQAINFIRAAQSDSGGWRYAPREGGDTSVTGWQVMALKSGQMAGLEVDDSRNPTLTKATKWLNSCMTADGSGYGYQGPEATPTMTAVGLLCRLYLGTGPKNSGIVGGVNRLKQSAPPAGERNMYYYYYYASQVMHHVGGDAWTFWEPRMRQLLLAAQDKGLDPKRRHQKGSWFPRGDQFAGAGGRIMSTSLAILTLEVYYRHLPLYRRDLGARKMMAAR